MSAPSSPYTGLCEDDGGEAMYRLIAELYPIGRSMTGDGVRATLDLLRAHVPITVHEVDSSLQPGYLTWGEFLLPGRSLDEVLISCHICLRSLSNGNLSGIALAAALAQRLLPARTRYSYRFLFIPSTIGSLTWLTLNQSRVFHIKHSLLLDCLGDSGRPNYELSRRGDAEIDRAVAFVLKDTGEDFSLEQFSPFNYDELQFSSPGLDLPVGCSGRTPWAGFSQCHMSTDDRTFVEPRYLHDSLMKLLTVIDVLDDNRIYVNRSLYGEPKLSEYDLTHLLGSAGGGEYRRALLWVLNSSDGSRSLLDIASDGKLRWDVAKEAAHGLVARGLIEPIEKSRHPPVARKRRTNRNFN